MSKKFLLLGQVTVPPVLPERLEAIVASVGWLGLRPEVLSWGQDSLHDIQDGFRQEFSMDKLVLAVQSHIKWFEIGSKNRSWSLRVATSPGEVRGEFNDGLLDPVSDDALDVWAAIFDIALSDWGVVGPEEALRFLSGNESHGVVRLPVMSWVTYLSLDVAFPECFWRIVQNGKVRKTRSRIGSALLSSNSTAVINDVSAQCPELFREWQRPVIDEYAVGGGVFLLRDVSPRAIAWLARSAEEVWRHLGGTDVEWTSRGLKEFERMLSSYDQELSPPVLEGWGALIGTVAVRAGGVWRRVLDPGVTFPDNLGVVLPNGEVFYPHIDVLTVLDGGPLPSDALASRLGG